MLALPFKSSDYAMTGERPFVFIKDAYFLFPNPLEGIGSEKTLSEKFIHVP